MRIAGIPSRVVLGYLGGEFNGNYVEVLQSDAHAWCEVWIRGVGWERIDPTSVIAPERITEGFDSYLASRVSGAGAAFRAGTRWAGLRRIYDGAHLFWANLTFQWDLRVLNYDSNHQRSLLAYTGLGGGRWSELSTGLVAMIVLILGAVALWLGRPAAIPTDPAARWFQRFCRVLAARGVERDPSEGPLHFTERAAARFPAEAEHLRRIGRLYVERRYGRNGAPIEELARAVRNLGRRAN